FPNVAGLRPTPDRVRETLFNWLAPSIVGAECLDLFAGSGVLGFEALSRGANKLIALEKHPEVVSSIRESTRLLGADQFFLITGEGLSWLANTTPTPFDIIFLDPPYHLKLLPDCFKL